MDVGEENAKKGILEGRTEDGRTAAFLPFSSTFFPFPKLVAASSHQQTRHTESLRKDDFVPVKATTNQRMMKIISELNLRTLVGTMNLRGLVANTLDATVRPPSRLKAS